MPGGLGAAEEHQPLAGLRAHLQAPDLLGPRLRQPGDDGAAGVGLDQLFGGPQPLGRCLGIDPDEAALVQALLLQARQVGLARGRDGDDLPAARGDLAQRGR